ncbi:MAG: hypothetical protein EBT73_06385, partial [Actinobacteria bacterium]|nr:hypothetical protein [Actinomycetota bacterium]
MSSEVTVGSLWLSVSASDDEQEANVNVNAARSVENFGKQTLDIVITCITIAYGRCQVSQLEIIVDGTSSARLAARAQFGCSFADVVRVAGGSGAAGGDRIAA